MFTEMISAFCGFAAGLGAALYAVRLENRKNKAEADLLIADVIYSLENILRHYRQNYRFHNIHYKLADLQQNTWHNKFLMEKFFLMTGLYEIDTLGRVRVRGNVDAPAVERFLAEVKRGEFNKLLQIVANIPSGTFYAHAYNRKKNTEVTVDGSLPPEMPQSKLL